MQQRILSGVRVLDFTQFVAGPTATRMMAEMGAEVIKVELAPRGDQARGMAYMKDGRSAYFVQHNIGKKSLCLDLRRPRALDLVKRLLPRIDVLVENFSPGTIGRLGLGWEAVHAANPDLIMCSISAFGQTGPLADKPGFDFIAQAYAGVTSMIGDPDGAPPMTNAAIGDVAAGIAALAAVNGALFWRLRHGGGGQHLDVSLLDAYFHSHAVNVQLLSNVPGYRAERSGRHHAAVAPAGIYRSKEGYVVVIGIGAGWPRVAAGIGRPDLVDDPRFRDNEGRMRNREALTAIIEDWLAAQESDAAAIARLEAAHVPCAPVLTLRQAMAHPHLIARGNARPIEDRGLDTFMGTAVPLKFSAFPDPLPLQAAYLGEHNAEVLGDLLGLGRAEIDALAAEGVLHAEKLPGAD